MTLRPEEATRTSRGLAEIARSPVRTQAGDAVAVDVAGHRPARRGASRAPRVGQTRDVDSGSSPARAEITAAGAALDAELRRAGEHDRAVRVLRACSRGGCVALRDFCAEVE